MTEKDYDKVDEDAIIICFKCVIDRGFKFYIYSTLYKYYS